tara:strand:- start:801 stop:1496 length:696 start_codon:yes stop_codon:yes gene_type:complete
MGLRRWDSLLESALGDSRALLLAVVGAVVVCLTGMHPHLHPALRPNWHTRMQVLQVAQQALGMAEARAALVATAPYTKEAVRRLLASSMAAAPAMHAALQHVNHPVGMLMAPPAALPKRGQEAAMANFVAAGVAMLNGERYEDAVKGAFRARENAAGGAWDPSWLGKGTASVRFAYHTHTPFLSFPYHTFFTPSDGTTPWNNFGKWLVPTCCTYASTILYAFSRFSSSAIA